MPAVPRDSASACWKSSSVNSRRGTEATNSRAKPGTPRRRSQRRRRSSGSPICGQGVTRPTLPRGRRPPRAARRPDTRLAAHVALRRAAGPRLRVDQPLARRRPAPLALRRRAVTRARADARGARDHLRARTATRCCRRSTPSRPSCATARFPFEDGDEDIHMAVERPRDRDRRAGRRPPAHRALAQRPGDHRRRDVRARGRGRRRRRGSRT